MAISKALLLAFIFSVTLLMVSDVVAARQLATEPFSTQQTQIPKLSKLSTNGAPTGYQDPPNTYDGGVGYPPGKR